MWLFALRPNRESGYFRQSPISEVIESKRTLVAEDRPSDVILKRRELKDIALRASGLIVAKN